MAFSSNDPDSQSVLIRIKAVPGASRDSIAGLLGNRLKVRIGAQPEGGKANKAICKLLAKKLDTKASTIEVHAGHTNPEKTIRIHGRSIAQLSKAFELDAHLIAFDT